MPRSTRDYMLRYADQAINNIDRSLESMLKIIQAYGNHHPDITEMINIIMESLVMVQDNIIQLKEERL